MSTDHLSSDDCELVDTTGVYPNGNKPITCYSLAGLRPGRLRPVFHYHWQLDVSHQKLNYIEFWCGNGWCAHRDNSHDVNVCINKQSS